MAGLNKFLHGTVWKQNNELVLIVSSDEYNARSVDINCVAIKGAAESVSFDNIQCNQIFTVKKEELNEFQGALPATLLAAVKARIRQQLNMGDDSGNVQNIRDTAAKLIG